MLTEPALSDPLLTMFLVLIGLSSLAALLSWRAGLVLAVVTGVLQDPLRKVLPHTPVILVVSTVPIWACLFLGVLRHGGTLRHFRRRYPRLARAASLFMLTLVPATVFAFKDGLETLPGIALGGFDYAAPVVAIAAGFAAARQRDETLGPLRFYALFTSAALVGTLIQHLDLAPGWAVLGTESLGADWIRYTNAGPITLSSGFYRSPELMSWHAAFVAMLCLTLALAGRRARLFPWIPLAAWAALCLLVGGRRKMMMMPVIWGAVMAAAMVATGRGRRVASLVAAGLLAIAGMLLAGQEFEVRPAHVLLAGSATTDAPERLEKGWMSVYYTYRQSGLLGAGIGATVQGGRYAGESAWQEDGVSKLMADLGAPGLLAGAWLAWMLLQSLRRVVQAAADTETFTVRAGLTGITIANLASYIVSHQAYGDPLVAVLAAFMVGACLRSIEWGAPRAAGPAPRRSPAPEAA